MSSSVLFSFHEHVLTQLSFGIRTPWRWSAADGHSAVHSCTAPSSRARRRRGDGCTTGDHIHDDFHQLRSRRSMYVLHFHHAMTLYLTLTRQPSQAPSESQNPPLLLDGRNILHRHLVRPALNPPHHHPPRPRSPSHPVFTLGGDRVHTELGGVDDAALHRLRIVPKGVLEERTETAVSAREGRGVHSAGLCVSIPFLPCTCDVS